MDITFVGSGNVAYALSALLSRAGHRIVQIISRRGEHARALAAIYEAAWSDHYSSIRPGADVVMLAVSDAALPSLNQNLRLGDQLVVHTAGGMPLRAIADISSQTGVFYPLQTLSKDIPVQHAFPLLLESNSPGGSDILDALARSITDRVEWMSSEERRKIHIAGVFCNNFTNRLIALAQHFCKNESLDFTLLEPLLQETFERVKGNQAEQIQTGPARRGDDDTIAMHTQVLKEYPDIQRLYRMFSDEIARFYDKKQRN